MSRNSPFISKPDEYIRDINPVKHMVHQQATHLSIMGGISYEEACEFVKHQLGPQGEFPLQDPNAIFLERDFDSGDREESSIPMSKYIGEILQQEQIYAPTFTTYHNPKVRLSPLSKFQDDNVKSRGKAKKAMFVAEQEEGKSSFNYQFYKGSQTTEKLANNAVSGAMVSEYNPLHNKTGHSSLTSSCRQTSAYGNANNERFLASNRHYWSYDTARQNIVSIVAHTDMAAVERVMTQYNLHYPTQDETYQVVCRSAKLYWNSANAYQKIRQLIDRLTPLQRAAFVYTGDMYQLKEFNEPFVREFMSRLIHKVDIADPTPEATIKKWPEDFLNLAKQLQPEITKGKSLNEIIKNDPHGYGLVAAQVEYIAQTLWSYSDMIRVFWATDNLPASIAMFPSSLRRVVLVSDTDSTIFTTQDWIIWYCKQVKFDATYDAITASMIFLASQSIVHILAKMSVNVGIGRDHAFTIEMKNEYKFDVFALTQLGKHYYAQISCQEGNIKKQLEKEIKGVHLKSSNAPKQIVKQAEQMMLSIMDDIMTRGTIKAHKYLKEVADLERSIVESIRKGEFKFLKLSTVKDAAAYKNGAETSTYKQYGMWNGVFGNKYGPIAPPPYKAIYISLGLDSKTKTNNWLEQMPDQDVAGNMRRWLGENARDKIPSLQLPLVIVSSKGIPDEIMAAIDVRKIVQKASAMFYLILETLGFYFNHDDLSQLAMDYY